MQIFFGFLWEYEKFKKTKNGSKRWNFGFWGAGCRKKSLLRESWSLIFFSGEVSEQSNQVAWNPDFWLKTTNNDPKQKDDSWEN